MAILPQPLLADIESVIFVLVVLFSLFGFISNLIKGNAGKPQQRGGQQRRPGELQNEIDDFLKEVLGDQPAKQRPNQRAQQPAQVEFVDDDLEVIAEPEARRLEQQERERQQREQQQRQRELRQQQERERREQQRRKQEEERRRRESRQRKEASAPVLFEDPSNRPGQRLKDRHIESTVESHVKSYMAHTVEQQQLGRGTVSPIVGVGLADYSDQSGVDTSSQIAQTLHSILRSPQGVQQAILMNEILSRPKGLQSRSH